MLLTTVYSSTVATGCCYQLAQLAMKLNAPISCQSVFLNETVKRNLNSDERTNVFSCLMRREDVKHIFFLNILILFTY